MAGSSIPFSPSTRMAASDTAISAGCAFSVSVNSASGPSHISRDSFLRQRRVDLVEHGPRGRIGLGKLGAHADCLAALPGKDESNAHRRWNSRWRGKRSGQRHCFNLFCQARAGSSAATRRGCRDHLRQPKSNASSQPCMLEEGSTGSLSQVLNEGGAHDPESPRRRPDRIACGHDRKPAADGRRAADLAVEIEAAARTPRSCSSSRLKT